MTDDVDEIVRNLTKAQRALVLALDGNEFRDWKVINRRSSVRDAVAPLTEFESRHGGVIKLFFSRRLTPLGLLVKARLEGGVS